MKLAEDMLRAARALARRRGISLACAVAEMERTGLKPVPRINTKTAFPSFRVSEDAKPITLEKTLRAEDEL